MVSIDNIIIEGKSYTIDEWLALEKVATKQIKIPVEIKITADHIFIDELIENKNTIPFVFDLESGKQIKIYARILEKGKNFIIVERI